MYKIQETVVVEGTYDKIKLSNFLDGVIFVTGGFSIMTDKKRIEMLKNLGSKTGVVILTDSDSAGFRIRTFVKQLFPPELVKHAYIPDVPGKERRKREPGKEGLIGVEGIDDAVLLRALYDAGCTIDGEPPATDRKEKVTKADLFAAGLSGTGDSVARRRAFACQLGLPAKISANMLIDIVNRLMSREEFFEKVEAEKTRIGFLQNRE